ncbi:MAG: hypothetical protein ACYTFG_16640 [Planctomycetota bacterium]|jgi:hypothetical protein
MSLLNDMKEDMRQQAAKKKKASKENEELDKMRLDAVLEAFEEYEREEIEGPILEVILDHVQANTHPKNKLTSIRSVLGSFTSAAEDMSEVYERAVEEADRAFLARPCEVCESRGWALFFTDQIGLRVEACSACQRLGDDGAASQLAKEVLKEYLGRWE